MAERLAVNEDVLGSSPSSGASKRIGLFDRFFCCFEEVGLERERGRENNWSPAWGDSEAPEGGSPMESTKRE